MIIRKFSKSRKIEIKIILGVFIISLFLVYFFINYKSKKIDDNFEDIDIKNISGSNISIKGSITKENLIGYGEYIFNSNKGIFYIRNYPSNVDNLIGKNIEIIGEVKKNGENNFFIINEIKDFTDLILISDNKYYFLDNLIVIDTNDKNDIIPKYENGKISIYYKNNHLFDIKPFLCSKISYYRDCNTMIKNFNLNENEYFNSYNGLIFYKNSEDKRLMFNLPLIGYNFEIENEETFLNISSIIYNIDSEYIIKNYSKNIIDNCNITGITEIKINGKYRETLDIRVKGKNDDKSNIDCSIGLNLFDNKVTKK